jgi:hypothetical protein
MIRTGRYINHLSAIRRTLLVLLLSFVCLFGAHATSIRGVTLKEMLLNSQLVFEGLVTESHTKQTPSGIISTSITFTITETIKGDHSGNMLTLEFLGGTVGSARAVVSGMQLPQLGEHGIYFVEAPGRKQVNPLYGWSQGHFIVKKDSAGTERVMTNRGIPVTGIEDISLATQAVGISSGVAKGVVTAADRPAGLALSIQEFKISLREMISQQQSQSQPKNQP